MIKVFDDFVLRIDSPEFKGQCVYFVSMYEGNLHCSSNVLNSRKYINRESASLDSDLIKKMTGYDSQIVKVGV